MKDRKSLLYVMVGFLAFAWWEAWRQDNAEIKTESAGQQVVALQIDDASVDSSVEGRRQRHALSVMPSSLLSTGNVAGSAVDGRHQRAVVTVRTDLIEATINLRGGNIEELKLLKYPQKLDSKQSVQLLSNAGEHLYVTSSGFSGNGSGSNGGFDTDSLLFSSERADYELGSDGQLVVSLQALDEQGVKYTRSYTFEADKYAIRVHNRLDNHSQQSWQGRFYAAISRHFDKEKSSFVGVNSYTGAAISSPDRPYHKVTFKELGENSERGSYSLGEAAGGWVAFQQRYFLSVWIPPSDQAFDYFGYLRDQIGNVGFYSSPLSVSAGDSYQTEATLYVGPELIEQLAPLAKGLDRTVDYGWLWIISNLFFQILQQLHKWIGNWGVCIIVVTILIKVAFYKLSENSYRSMARMKQLAPKLNDLKKRYGDDKQALSQATMELYRKEGVNPLSMGGCLPMLVQIPFFIAFYYVLSNAIEFRQSPFVWWIKDLSDKDPYYVLPVLMGISMWLQQKLSPSTVVDDSQAKAMMLMPVIFTAMFINFPSGLVLYWLVNNLLSIAQQWYINRRVDRDGAMRVVETRKRRK